MAAFAVPHWFVAAVTAILAAVWLGRVARRRRRARSRLCTSCGYDIRATPARCPECGTVATPAPGAAV